MYAQAGTATMKVVTSEQYTDNKQKLTSVRYSDCVSIPVSPVIPVEWLTILVHTCKS